MGIVDGKVDSVINIKGSRRRTLFLYLFHLGAWCLITDELAYLFVSNTNCLARLRDWTSLVTTVFMSLFLLAHRVIINSDVQKEREMIQGYRRSIQLQNLLFTKARDPIIITDPQGKILEVNERAIKQYEYKHDEFINLNLSSLVSPFSGCSYLPNQDSDSGGVLLETVHRRKDGSCFSVEVSSQGVILNDESVIINLIRDISEGKNTRQALERSEMQYRALFHNINDAVFLYTFNDLEIPDKYIDVNFVACKKLDYTQKELLSLGPRDIYARGTDEWQERIRWLLEELSINSRATVEWAYKTKTGQELPVELSCHIFFLNGQKVGLSVARDISKRKKDGQKIAVTHQETIRIINIPDIIMITRVDRKTVLYTTQGQVETYEPLQEIEDKLCPETFFRCHKSYIINSKLVTEITPWGNKTYLIKLANTAETALITVDKLKQFKLKYC